MVDGSARTELPLEALRRAVAPVGGIDLLVLFGSRARREGVREASDWDFGFVGAVDPEALRLALANALGADAIDVADLTRANALLRYRAARDGIAVVEAHAGAFDDFRVAAATFYCDIAPVLSGAYDGVLERLGA
jgi:predicted nucleotidyltransferase